jgi:predicted negative regulator of RcsB-dependent stress response
MTPQPVATRSRRPHHSDDGEDILVARTLAFSEWARRNSTVVIVAALLVLGAVVGVLYYRAQQEARLERAGVELFQLDRSAAFTSPPSLMEQLESFIRRYDGTSYANEARLMLARTAIEEGELQRALGAVEGIGSRPRRSALHAQAGVLLAGAREAAGDLEGAERAYLEVARRARSELHRLDGYIGAAGVRETAGDHAGAAEFFAEAVELAPEGSPLRSFLEMRRTEAEHRAADR